MTRVSNEELSLYSSDKTLNNLDELSNNMKNAGRILDNFATYSSRRLKGEGYDAIRTVASFLANAFNKLAVVDANTHDNIKQSLNSFISFMEDYSKLDDSSVNHLGDGLRYIGTQIGMLQLRIQKGEFEGDDLVSANSQLAYWRSKYEEILKEYNKLRDLAVTDSSTGACLDQIESDTNKFKTILVDGMH